MKPYRTNLDRLLCGGALLTGTVYLGIFCSAFASLPLHITPLHQLLLCRTRKTGRGTALPLLAVVLPALFFVALCGFQITAWYLAAFWAAAPLLGIALAWAVWLIGRRFNRRNR